MTGLGHNLPPGPRWAVPVELVRAAANADGIARLTREALNHVLFRPHAELVLTADGMFVAAVKYETYRKDELRILPVRLNAVPQENSFGGQG